MRHVNQQERVQVFWEKLQQEACPLCQGTGFRLIQTGTQTSAQKCRCISKDRIKALRMKSGIPPAYWNESLEEYHAQSLEEVSLVDSLKSFLHMRELPGLHVWIVPIVGMDIQRILYGFANGLIQFFGYSCLWLDCSILARNLPKFSSERMSHILKSANEVDFLFIENYQPGGLKSKWQLCLEEVLRARIRSEKSIFLLTQFPIPSNGSQDLFLDRKLGMAILKEFRVIEPGKSQNCFHGSRWLF